MATATKKVAPRKRSAEKMSGEEEKTSQDAAALVVKINGNVWSCRYADADLPVWWQLGNEGRRDMTVYYGDGDEEGHLVDGTPYSKYKEDLEHEHNMRSSRLHLAAGMAKASLHRAIVGRPGLAVLLGPQQCASLVTSEDTAAETAASKDWPGCDHEFKSFIGPKGQVIIDLVRDLEALAAMVAGGLPLSTRVPAAIPKNPKNRKAALAKGMDGLVASKFVSLDQWLRAHAPDFGSATVTAIKGAVTTAK